MFKRESIDTYTNIKATLVLVFSIMFIVSLVIVGPIFLTLYLAGLAAYTTQVLLTAILISVTTFGIISVLIS
jgi:hypothetical protein